MLKRVSNLEQITSPLSKVGGQIDIPFHDFSSWWRSLMLGDFLCGADLQFILAIFHD